MYHKTITCPPLLLLLPSPPHGNSYSVYHHVQGEVRGEGGGGRGGVVQCVEVRGEGIASVDMSGAGVRV